MWLHGLDLCSSVLFDERGGGAAAPWPPETAWQSRSAARASRDFRNRARSTLHHRTRPPATWWRWRCSRQPGRLVPLVSPILPGTLARKCIRAMAAGLSLVHAGAGLTPWAALLRGPGQRTAQLLNLPAGPWDRCQPFPPAIHRQAASATGAASCGAARKRQRSQPPVTEAAPAPAVVRAAPAARWPR